MQRGLKTTCACACSRTRQERRSAAGSQQIRALCASSGRHRSRRCGKQPGSSWGADELHWGYTADAAVLSCRCGGVCTCTGLGHTATPASLFFAPAQHTRSDHAKTPAAAAAARQPAVCTLMQGHPSLARWQVACSCCCCCLPVRAAQCSRSHTLCRRGVFSEHRSCRHLLLDGQQLGQLVHVVVCRGRRKGWRGVPRQRAPGECVRGCVGGQAVCGGHADGLPPPLPTQAPQHRAHQGGSCCLGSSASPHRSRLRSHGTHRAAHHPPRRTYSWPRRGASPWEQLRAAGTPPPPMPRCMPSQACHVMLRQAGG
jgi:hypothetical protein